MSELNEKLAAIQQTSLELEAQKLLLLDKAFKSSDPPSVVRAYQEMQALNTVGQGDQKSYTMDFMQTNMHPGYLEHQQDLNFDTLRVMARVPIIRSIIDTKLAKMTMFTTPTSDDNSVGWRIRLKKKASDSGKKELTDAQKKKIDELTEYVMNCGVKDPKTPWYDSDMTFPKYFGMQMKDSLEIDQCVSELISNRRGELLRWIPVDGATYRFASPVIDPSTDPRTPIRGVYPRYVQVYQSRIYAEFYPWELSFGVRNQPTDYRSNGYGVSELEDLMRIITWMLNGDTYNGKFFSQGAAPKGILKISGNVGRNSLDEFRRMWMSMVAGVNNAWKTPILEGDKIDWVDLQKSNQDMQFHVWMEYLIKVACAVFKIDPAEVGFHFSSGSGEGGQYSSTKQKVDYSKDKGLYPLLKFGEHMTNSRYIWTREPDYEFVFTGMSPEDETTTIEQDVKRVSNYMTMNEIRERRGLKAIDGGDIVLNPMFVQGHQTAIMEAQNDEDYMDSPFTNQDDRQKSDNPMLSDLLKWVDEGMPSELEKVPAHLMLQI